MVAVTPSELALPDDCPHPLAELKGKFEPEFAGKLGFCIAAVGDRLRDPARHAPTADGEAIPARRLRPPRAVQRGDCATSESVWSNWQDMCGQHGHLGAGAALTCGFGVSLLPALVLFQDMGDPRTLRFGGFLHRSDRHPGPGPPKLAR